MGYARVLTLNLRNIERPKLYGDAVNRREAARADIQLANEQELQELVKANTTIKNAKVTAQEKKDLAHSQAQIKVTNAVNNIREAARADTLLATEENTQEIVKAN